MSSNKIMVGGKNNTVKNVNQKIKKSKEVIPFDGSVSRKINEIKYDLGISFAREDEKYIRKFTKYLKKNGVKTFHCDHEKVDLWGKNLYDELNDVYQNRCKYVIVFLSEHYMSKFWTKHEFKSAQLRAIQGNAEYMILVSINGFEIPELFYDRAYLDTREFKPKGIAKLVLEKLSK